ncbi:hypothetical protein ACF1BN_01455 [Streptomyces sp. NPDC014861]|uniref:hypothetical protein n=1 Tax=Streptomyces sp. NPDC014861 TaxID=3364923 RepID=UPI0036F70C28
MPRVSGFDRRATALVEVHGLRGEHELFEEALAARGWPVLDRQGRDPQPLVERRVRYLIEARFPGSRLNAVSGARQRIELIAEECGLDLQVQAVECVERDPRDLPHWFAYEAPRVPAGAGPAERARGRLARWAAENLGTRDTGRLITARTPQAARWLAARPLPGTRARSEAAARRPSGAAPTPARRVGGRRESSRTMGRLIVVALLGLLLGARQADVLLVRDRWSWTSTVLLAVLVGSAEAVLSRAPGDGGSRAVPRGVAAGLVLCSAGLGAYLAWTVPDPGITAPVLVALAAGAAVANGVRLLVRQWSWQRVAPWLLPALIPLAFGLLPGVGTTLHMMYLDAFGVDLEDVEIPRAYQLMAMLKLAACLSLWFLAPALLGYMKHFHLHVKDRVFGNLVVLALSVLLVVTGLLEIGLLGAGRAGARDATAAAAGRTPPGYYGIDPEWVCPAPVGALAEVPVDGGVLDPKRAYLKLGDSGGVVVLWDARERAGMKVPLEKLRLVPADSARTACGADTP